MEKITRFIEDHIVASLEAFPVVYIAGPRQSGKTTLVQNIAKARHKADYITFDDIQTRQAAKHDANAFLRSFKGPVVLDEIQMVPELFRPLKMLVDENRQHKTGGRGLFLLTGSASIMCLPQLADALVGRMVLHTLPPFSTCEITHKTSPTFIDRAFSSDWHFVQYEEEDLFKIMRQASFPELLDLTLHSQRYSWCNGYINTILQRDIRNLQEIEKIETLPDMLRLFATRSGGILNESSIARNMDLNHATIKKYRTLFEGLFLIESIPAWTNNLSKRLIKSPKIYMSDINLWSYLLNIDLQLIKDYNPALCGQIFETFVAIELTKQIQFSHTKAQLFHYRTTSMQEVDFILEGPQQHIIGIEVKAKSKVELHDFRHLIALKQDYPEKFQRGFVMYTGTVITPFGEDMWAVPISTLWNLY